MPETRPKKWLAIDVEADAEAVEAVEYAFNSLDSLGTEIDHLRKSVGENLKITGYFHELPGAELLNREIDVGLRIYNLPCGSIHSGSNNNNSGSSPSAIQAGYNPGSASAFTAGVYGDVSVMLGGNIIADAGDGINAYDYGTGTISVSVGPNVSIQALNSAASVSGNGNAPFGIGVFNYGHGDIHVTMSNGDVIRSGSSGINSN